MAATAQAPARAANGPRMASLDDAARRVQLAELQRLRILDAVMDVACESGAANANAVQVVERAGVSRRTFYELFADREECFLAALEQALAWTVARVAPAYESETGWRQRMRAGLVAMLCLFDEQPQLGQLLVCESLAGGQRALAWRAGVLDQLRDVVEAGRAEGNGSTGSLPLLGEGVVGGVLTVLQKRLSEPDRDTRLLDLTNSLMSMIVLPYLGVAAARRECDRPVLASIGTLRSAPRSRDPFKEAGLRMTYRSIRVLMAIGEHAEASNRTIGQAAGVADQGQISKLLARLQRVGLIENTYVHAGPGSPNSWALTEKGQRLTDSIRAHTEDNAGTRLPQGRGDVERSRRTEQINPSGGR